jgi:hypothetical protein
MNHRRWMLGLACLGLANVAFAAGGTIRPATTGLLNYITVLNLPTGTNDRVIVRYGTPGTPSPNGSEFDPNSVICGARARAGHQSNVSVDRPVVCDVRLEDPLNPGFPTVAADAPIGGTTIGASGVGADSNGAPAQCASSVSYENFTFGGGLGARDPLQAIFLTWKIAGVGTNDPCWIGLETAAPYNGRGLYYNSVTATYGQWGNNLWLEANVFTPRTLTLNFRMHGSAQFPGDPGQKIWFIRADAAGTITDDYITTSIVIDNGTGGVIGPQNLSLLADQSAVNPKLGLKDMTSSFRLISNPKVSLASGNPYSYAPGRTRLEANIPATIASKFIALMPLQVPFIGRTGPTSNPGAFHRTQALGLRGHRGTVDSGIATVAYIVQPTTITLDALATRFPLRRLFPRTGVSPSNTAGTGTPVASINVTSLDVNAASNGGAGGFDAVQLRRADPVVLNAADQSPQGLLGGAGIVADGNVDVPIAVDPNGFICHVSANAQSPAIAVSNADDVWIMTYPQPGDTTAGGSFVCADLQADTYLGQSFFSVAGAQPYTKSDVANFMQRMVFTTSFTGPGDGTVPADPQSGALQPRAGNTVPTQVRSQR